jgi:hypothetical protein
MDFNMINFLITQGINPPSKEHVRQLILDHSAGTFSVNYCEDIQDKCKWKYGDESLIANFCASSRTVRFDNIQDAWKAFKYHLLYGLHSKMKVPSNKEVVKLFRFVRFD